MLTMLWIGVNHREHKCRDIGWCKYLYFIGEEESSTPRDHVVFVPLNYWHQIPNILMQTRTICVASFSVRSMYYNRLSVWSMFSIRHVSAGSWDRDLHSVVWSLVVSIIAADLKPFAA
jgi:hypothetical protein